MAERFDEEILEWSLDQDSLQNLLVSAQTNWGLGRAEALHKVLEFAERDLISFYEDLPNHKGSNNISRSVIDIDYVDRHVYTWMMTTAKSIPYLNELRRRRS